MRNEQNPHIESTENRQNLDGSPVITSDCEEPVAVSLRRRIGILEREAAAIAEKMEALPEDPRFSEKQRRLISAYLEDTRYRFRYRSIKREFILPFQRLLDESSRIKRELDASVRRYAILTGNSNGTAE
ncbi:MAG: hypothetical protein J6T24_01600 [Clostridia bacterium]|nr:hypothetical protein [Clostridia bacterium]